jgi:CRP-like cAMP-binding protein
MAAVSTQPKLPDLAQLTARLAADNARVARYIERLPEQIDKLVAAVDKAEWDEVQRICDYLARTSQTYGCEALYEQARRVSMALQRRDDELAVKRSVIHLLGAYGRLRAPAAACAGK